MMQLSSHKREKWNWTAAQVVKAKENERRKRDIEAKSYVEYVEAVYGPFRSRAYTLTLLHFMKLQKHEIWLDAGAGVGRMSLEMAPDVRELVCLDHSSASLENLSEEAQRKEFHNIRIVHGDLCQSELGTNRFDGILCSEVLQHIPSNEERLNVLRRLYKSLKPGGRCLVNVIRWKDGKTRERKEGYWGEGNEIYRYYFTQEEIGEVMEASGFDKVSIRSMDIIPGFFTRAVPQTFAFVDVWCSRYLKQNCCGNNVLAIGTKTHS